MSMLFALCAVTACSDTSNGVSDTQASLRRGAFADAGFLGDVDMDDDTDESAEEALKGDGGHEHVAHDGGKGPGKIGRGFGDGGCTGSRMGFGKTDSDDADDADDADDEQTSGAMGSGMTFGGKGKGFGVDGGLAP